MSRARGPSLRDACGSREILESEARVNVKLRPVYKARRVGCEEDYGLRHLRRLGPTAKRGEPIAEFILLGRVQRDHRCVGDTRVSSRGVGRLGAGPKERPTQFRPGAGRSQGLGAVSRLEPPGGSTGPISDPRPSIQALLADPTVSTPLKVVLRTWSGRDPLDAACDAGLLALALERVADERCGRDIWSAGWRRQGGRDDSHPT